MVKKKPKSNPDDKVVARSKLSEDRTKIILAVIGLISIFIGGYFRLRAIRDPFEMALHATQTAEAKQTAAAILAAAMSNSTNTATITPSPSTTLTINPTSTNTSIISTTITPTTTPENSIVIGLVDIGEDYLYRDIGSRLGKLGRYRVEWITPESNYYELKKYEIIYLPSGWASIASKVQHQSDGYIEYVKNGGGLLVEQPNSNERFTPTILPFQITFISSKYQNDDWPPKIINPNHFITQGLTGDNMPGPLDQIRGSDIDEQYKILVVGKTTLSPSLVIANYEQGRILISAGNASLSSNVPYKISDEVLIRMIDWLGKKDK